MPSFTNNLKISFKNEHTIYESYVYCRINENDYNLTYNPSLLLDPTNPSSSIQDFATGSNFEPYVTTIGLYNDNNELIMVGKLAKPIPISQATDMTFIIKVDI